jgi:hypothetical protein
MRSFPPLSAAGLLDQKTCARLMYLFLSVERAQTEGVTESDGPDLTNTDNHANLFCFAPPLSDEGTLLVTPQFWCRLLLRAFQALTACPTVLLAKSCCFKAFVDSLGVASFRALSSCYETSPEVLGDAHLLFFGLQYWISHSETQLPRTCALVPSVRNFFFSPCFTALCPFLPILTFPRSVGALSPWQQTRPGCLVHSEITPYLL